MKKIGEWILSFFCNKDYYNDIRGDLEELHTRRIKETSRIYADFKYLIAVVMLFRLSLIKPFKFHFFLNSSMINQYLKASARNFSRHKANALINIFGLSVAVAAAILLYGYVRFELSYDKGYDNKERIYRVNNHSNFRGRVRTGITGSGLLAPTLEGELPEVELAGRRHHFSRPVIQFKEKKFKQSLAYYADPNLTKILEYSYLMGDSESALDAPNSVVLTKTTALKIFENESDAIGKQLLVNQVAMQVTGVIEDIPANNHFTPSMLVSMSTMSDISWDRVGTITYVLLKNGIATTHIADKMSEMVERLELGDPDNGFSIWFDLYPITEIHLSKDKNQHGKGNINMLYALSMVAVFILLIACINYMNLATARSSLRAKEIGVRKVAGAIRKQISFQFLFESLFISTLSVAFGTVIALAFQNGFVQLTGVPATINFFDKEIFILLIGLAVAVGIISGSYPSVILSSFKPVLILKGTYPTMGSQSLRRVLVAFQFTISIILIVSTFIVYQQIDFLLNKDLGFNKEAVYTVALGDPDTNGVLKQKYLQHPNIKGVTSTNLMPATGDSGATFTIQSEEGETFQDNVSMATVDNDYFSLMDLELVQGEFLDTSSTGLNFIIVNETLVNKYGWEEPIGKFISIPSGDEEGSMERFVIQGVVKDFNMLSLYQDVQPFAFFKKPKFNWGRQYLFLKLDGRNLLETITYIQEQFELFDQKSIFTGSFLDAHLESVYRKELKTARIFLVFAVLTITIACLGLFGLATFSLERRIKEISIRKVLGANIGNIVKLATTEFVIIILISGLIAAPVVFYLMEKWLDGFSYHIDVTLMTLISGVLVALTIAMLTVSIQTIRTARTNPARTLKYE